MTNTETEYRMAPDIRFRRVLDEAVVVKQDNNQVIVINEVSASILDIFEEQETVTAEVLVNALNEAYDVDRPTLEKDIQSHLEELQSAEIITSVTGHK